MHPLMPGEFVFRSAKSWEVLETLELPDTSSRKARPIAARIAMTDLFYSFGVSHPGVLTLHNYPRHLHNLVRDNGEPMDLAAIDSLRDREHGVPRYNQFRCLLRKEPVNSFEELTTNGAWREELRRVDDNDLEKIDLMTGLYAEPLLQGLGFSETAFRIFVLMASRRLESDRFFTDDYRPEACTSLGLNHVRHNGMVSILKRHHPGLAESLEGAANPFTLWRTAEGAPVKSGRRRWV